MMERWGTVLRVERHQQRSTRLMGFAEDQEEGRKRNKGCEMRQSTTVSAVEEAEINTVKGPTLHTFFRSLFVHLFMDERMDGMPTDAFIKKLVN